MTTLIDAPTRADGLLLVGTMVGSGYRTPPALVRRRDGQTLQLTPLVYQVLQAIDGRRSYAEIATVVREAMRRDVSEDIVATVVDRHLRPLGLLKLADGSEPPVKQSNPLLALRFKFAFTDPRTTRRLTDPFRILFRSAVATWVVLGFVAVTWWVFFHQGLAPAAYDAFQRPHLLLLVFAVTVLSAGFHEFGHAAAARYGGADPGVIGAGLYLAWPAFYTDVTDSYRLGRRGRIRTDLGGLYFNAVVVVLTFVSWYVTGWDALLLVVATQILQMVQQLMPMLRFDGYHLLADLTGVPDLYHRIKPTLLGLLPHRWWHPENRVLKPWARAVITLWVLVTIPLMAFMLLTLVTTLPRVLGTAWAAIRQNAAAVEDAWQHAATADVLAHSLQVLAVVLPVLAGLLILARIGRRWVRGLVRWSRGSARKRVAAVALLTAVAVGLSWAWAPRPGNYRPIGPHEKGLLTAMLPDGHDSVEETPAASQPARAIPAWGVAPTGAQATFAAGQPLPTRSHPQLAMVLLPSYRSRSDGPTALRTGMPSADLPSQTTEPWVFPFDKPPPPAEGDNQAAAYNTADDSVVYDVAFALVWATGDEVYNVNEAHAYASCSNCVTVAVAFQVLLVMDDARVIVPQNLAVAANYKCYACITAAIASQLVLSLEGTPGDEQLLAIGAVWDQLTEFARTITTYSLSAIVDQLDALEAQIVAILGEAPLVPASTSTATAPDAGTAAGDPSVSTAPSTSTASPDQTTTAPDSTASSPSTSPDDTASTSDTSSTDVAGTTPDSTTDTTSPTPSPEPTPTDPTPSP